MTEPEKKEPISVKLSDFILKNRHFLIGILVLLVVVAVAFAVFAGVSTSAVTKGISAIDSIDYSFRKDTEEISDEDFAKKQDEALAALEEYMSKGGILGVRSNMLAADIYFQKENFEESRNCWLAAAKAGKKNYTTPVSYYNAAVCSENLGDFESAVEYYSTASKADDFFLVDHCYFSLGRANEAKGDVEAAKAAYTYLSENFLTSTWASLAKTRLIALEISENSK